jgi:hypothetical protein
MAAESGERSSRVFFCQFLRNLIAQFLGQANSGYLPTPV